MKTYTIGDVEAAFLFGWDAGYAAGSNERLRVANFDADEARERDTEKYMAREAGAPTPMPAPALGMRVWIDAVAVASGVSYTTSVDVHEIMPGSGPTRWDCVVRDPTTITIITDFRTNEVLWRRS